MNVKLPKVIFDLISAIMSEPLFFNSGVFSREEKLHTIQLNVYYSWYTFSWSNSRNLKIKDMC